MALTRRLAARQHAADAQRALLRCVLALGGGGQDVHHAQRCVPAVRVCQVREQATDDVVAAHALAGGALHHLVPAWGGERGGGDERHTQGCLLDQQYKFPEWMEGIMACAGKRFSCHVF